MPKSQSQRILAALQAAGDQGVRAEDISSGQFDDGSPIIAVAPRISELRDKGWLIENRSGLFVKVGKGSPREKTKRRRKKAKTAPARREAARRVPASRLDELFQMEERAAATGKYASWLPARKNFIRLAQAAYELNTKVFYMSVPGDEREMVLNEALDALDALVELVYLIDVRIGDDEVRDTLKALTENMAGRTDAEKATAARLAARKAKRIRVKSDAEKRRADSA